MKKENLFIQLSLLEPNWQARNILMWLARGNYHLVTQSDYEKLGRLFNRVTEDDLKEWFGDVLAILDERFK